jgi:hypothetical protein
MLGTNPGLNMTVRELEELITDGELPVSEYSQAIQGIC